MQFDFFWHDGDRGQGAIETGFCVLKILEGKANTNNNDNLEIVPHSDNCYCVDQIDGI